MFDGQDDAIVTVTAEIEVGIAPGMELRRSAQGLPGADGARRGTTSWEPLGSSSSERRDDVAGKQLELALAFVPAQSCPA